MYSERMNQSADVLAALEGPQILELFDWVGRTVHERVFQDYDEEAGHNRTTGGTLAHAYLVDRFDRATGCGRFKLAAGASQDEGAHLVRAGISDEDFKAMPRIKPGVVGRSNCNGSAGWACGDIRWVLQSHEFGRVDRINWSQKSPTKQVIASEPYAEDPHVLFGYDELGMEAPNATFTGTTLVLAHAFNGRASAYEMHLGRSRKSSPRELGPWHWRVLVAAGGSDTAPVSRLDWAAGLPGTAASVDVPDTPVRLRPAAASQITDQK